MEDAKEFLQLNKEEAESVSRLTIHPHRLGFQCSFYEDFALRGIRVDSVRPGFVSCTFRVPPRLTDKSGNLATGAVANLVDEVGGAIVHVEGLTMNVSVDMSISFLGTAKLNDEIQITSKVLGRRGSYSGTIVLVRNKVTGELIAEGRHSLFDKHAKEFLQLNKEVAESVSRLNIQPTRVGFQCSFYEDFALRGIRVDTVQPGFVSCTLKVPSRLTDKSGNLAKGAVANLVDEVGAAVVHVEGLPMNVSVDMSISFLGTAKLNDELEITSKVLGQRGSYSGTIVLVRNKATGELIAEGRHSLFGKKSSKL
ncbi:Acyl-coenzyme A thioesterase 13 [Gossypium australe]|uniref:Acyl-coenzyme A thioesterase 13 n=1 Tax=Gossypium australe TaxID=47621 RepID=A0A5B6X671_9ROSI|nr:Acyl-coenzyme A thioesterase 13 [Gossypium australe]